MNEAKEKNNPKEVVKGNSSDFVKKAKAVDKKPVAKHIVKSINKKPAAKTENKSGSDKNEPPKVKKPLSRAQIAERKYGVESTWRPFEIFFNKQTETEPTKK
jgi:hypothetical protein